MSGVFNVLLGMSIFLSFDRVLVVPPLAGGCNRVLDVSLSVGVVEGETSPMAGAFAGAPKVPLGVGVFERVSKLPLLVVIF